MFSDRLSSRIPPSSRSRCRRWRPCLRIRNPTRASSSEFRRKFLHRRKSGWSSWSSRPSSHFGFVSQRPNETGKAKFIYILFVLHLHLLACWHANYMTDHILPNISISVVSFKFRTVLLLLFIRYFRLFNPDMSFHPNHFEYPFCDQN